MSLFPSISACRTLVLSIMFGALFALASCAAAQRAGKDADSAGTALQRAYAAPPAAPVDAITGYKQGLAAMYGDPSTAGSQSNEPFVPPTVYWEDAQAGDTARQTKRIKLSDAETTTPAKAVADTAVAETATVAAPPNAPKAQAFGVARQVAPAATVSGDRRALLDALRKQVRAEESPLRAAIINAALSLADAQPSEALDPADLKAVDRDQAVDVQRFQQLLIALLEDLSDGNGDINRRDLVKRMDEALGRQPLTIPDVQLCTRVDNFGLFDAIPKLVFVAGQSTPVIVYSEVDHFQPRSIAGGQNEVRLVQEISLYEDGGLKVWDQPAASIIDRSRNVRRDFYIVEPITLPANLTVGRYQLKVTIRDEYGGSRGERSLPLEVVAGMSGLPQQRLIQNGANALDRQAIGELLDNARR